MSPLTLGSVDTLWHEYGSFTWHVRNRTSKSSTFHSRPLGSSSDVTTAVLIFSMPNLRAVARVDSLRARSA
ncbi:MAG: hypothetical protein ABSB52_07100 [Acidimicrobiales bacterium]|jgi:hypothetical protein